MIDMDQYGFYGTADFLYIVSLHLYRGGVYTNRYVIRMFVARSLPVVRIAHVKSF